MSQSDLADKYGQSKSPHQRINAAIRAELPGGSEALDALARLRPAGDSPGLAAVRAIIDAMAAEIRRRYGLPPLD